MLHGLCSASCSSHRTLVAQASKCSLAGDFSLPFVNLLIQQSNKIQFTLHLFLQVDPTKKKVILIHSQNRNNYFFSLNAVKRMFPVLSAPGSTALQQGLMDIPSESSTARALFKETGVCAFRLRKA